MLSQFKTAGVFHSLEVIGMKKKKVIGIFSIDRSGNGRIDIAPNPEKGNVLPIKDGEEVRIVVD